MPATRPSSHPEPAAPEGARACEEMLWLLGQPSLEDYLDFLRTRTTQQPADLAKAAAAWRQARDRFAALGEAQAGAADHHVPEPLDPALVPKADGLKRDPYFAGAFDTFPTEVAMVEVDRLVVHQRHIAATYAERRAAGLAAASPDAAALFDFCLPVEREQPPVRIERLREGRYLFSSLSTDLRAHHPTLLTAEQAAGFSNTGPIAGVIGLVVGYGSNYLSAIRFQGRLLLHNGYHRAYSLHAAGIRRAPCVIQTVTRMDELEAAASGRVLENIAHYFTVPRPPMLRDYFDPQLAARHRVLPCETSVELEFKVREGVAVASR